MKKFTVIMILAVMIFACLVSCAENPPANVPKDTKAATETATVEQAPVAITEEEEDTGDYEADLPEEKFTGDFNILCEGNFWATDSNLYKEEASDDPVDNGVWMRVDKIREQFEADIIVTPSANTAGDLKVSINSGDRAFNAVCQRMPLMASSASNNELMNLYDVDGIDLSKAYWDQSANKQLSIGGKLYYTVGDIITNDDACTWVMMFNKKLAEIYDFPNLYEIVEQGKWTFDYFYQLLKTDDLSHSDDATWDYEDRYAFSTHRDMAYGFFYGADLSFVGKDERDIPYIIDDAQSAEKTQKVLEFALKVMRQDNLTLDAHKWVHVNQWATVLTEACFREDRAMFYAEVLSTVISLRDMDTEFGLLPMPKYNEAQKDYTTYVNTAASFIGVPKYWEGTTDARRSGVILEAMAYYGHEYITPEYMEKTIKGKGTRDFESIGMLNIIMKHRISDLGNINDWGGLASGFSNLVFNNKNSYASVTKSGIRKAKNALTKFFSKLNIED